MGLEQELEQCPTTTRHYDTFAGLLFTSGGEPRARPATGHVLGFRNPSSSAIRRSRTKSSPAKVQALAFA